VPSQSKRRARRLAGEEARGEGLVTREGDVVEGSGEAVPTGARGIFEADDVSGSIHADGAAAGGTIDELDFDVDGGADFDALRAEEEDAAGADVGGYEGRDGGLDDAGDAAKAKGKGEEGARVEATFVGDFDGMCGDASECAASA
jgi:hypothetical protein